MKKVLSILFCVLLSLGNVLGKIKEHNICAYAIDFNRNNTNEYGGGSVAIQGYTYFYNSLWDNGYTAGAWTDFGITKCTKSTYSDAGNQYSGFIASKISLKAQPDTGYIFIKWVNKNDISATSLNWKQEFEDHALTTDEGWSESVTSSNYYAVFRRYYTATLYAYNAEEDLFHQTPLDNAEEVYNDAIEISSSKFEKLYKLTFNHSVDVSNLSVTSEKFDCSIDKIDDDIVLKVKDKGQIDGTVSEDIKISVNGEWNADKVEGGAVATLRFSVSNGAIFVTLNPAEDLKGTYTYTQSTTGSQQFKVTTSAIVKQMVTSTDYLFTFTPQSQDDKKYQFEKWVIKDGNGKVLKEFSTLNLSYRFSAGESITPVFTLVDRALFIVKSEPNVKYINLQEALDRAAALGKNQVVVVTVEGNRKGGRLVQGNYRIHGGVTLLVPGESGYNTMIGDLKESDFGDGANKTAFCTLTVDDNTTITVEDGNISLYAKLATTVASAKYVVSSEYGHIVLGKNSEIIVEKGGLYAFGYITGDVTSHITMKSGTVVYEPFKMTDWRGGSETIGNWVDVPALGGTAGIKSRVFPIGQYYIQSVEVPMTLEYNAKEVLSCCVEAGGMTVPVNMPFIWNYDQSEGLFGLSQGTSITKSYNPTTDRLKFEFNGSGSNSSNVKIGNMTLKIKVGLSIISYTAEVKSKDYVMPIQNNMDVDVKNTTIDVHYDLAFLPGSMMRVHDDAVINLQHPESGKVANVYVYDRGARLLDNGSGYWYQTSNNKTIVPLTVRPGGMKETRTDDDLVDARLIINGDMNITERGGLFTVSGKHADVSEYDPNAIGGAQIMSEGSGKINVGRIDNSITTTKQWQQGSGAQDVSLTSPNLLLHNSIAAGAEEAYTSVTQTGVSYTYYQHDGTWRLPQGGITGIKLYDKDGNEIEKILVTNPTVESVSGYLLATLEESIDGVTYEYKESDFSISLEGGNVVKSGVAAIENGNKLRIPITYTVQKKHGDNPTTLTIANSESVDFECNISMVINATEDYTPIFEVPASLNIYGRVSESTATALPIEYPAGNVIEATDGANALTTSNPKWVATITGTGKDFFQFQMGENGNGLADAKVIFKPANDTPTTATLKLKAVYTDENGAVKESVERTIALTGTGLMIANTLDFNYVGTVTVNSTSFKLLKNINSKGAITMEPDPAANPNAVVDIKKDADGNYTITPKAMGSVTVTVTQEAKDAYVAKTITTTIAVVGDPRPLTEVSCITDEESFKILTANLNEVEYSSSANAINFVSEKDEISTWSAHFVDMPGTLTFTPRGNGYWYIQESNDGVVWTELVWGTQLPNAKMQTIAMNPKSKNLRIMYMPTSAEDIGSIAGLCITPFAVHAETTKLYVPVKEGAVQPTSVAFIHKNEDIKVSVGPLNAKVIDPTNITNPQVVKDTRKVLNGVYYDTYKTTVTLSGGANIPELNDGFELIATQGEATASVALATYAFPKPLQIVSDSWTSNVETDNVNGYDESEHYYWYMTESKNVKWDAERKNVVFLNVENKEGDNKERQVVFGFDGLPDVVSFKSATTEWRIEESIDNIDWSEAVDNRTVEVVEGVNTIAQPINHTSKYVRITYTGKVETEVLITGLVIKGSPSAEPETTELKVAPSNTMTIHVMNLPSMKLRLANTIDFTVSYGSDETSWTELTNATVLSSTQYDCLAENREGDITIKVEWLNTKELVQDTYLEILNGQDDKELAKVRVVGNKSITIDNAAETGISTGIPDGYTYNKTTYQGYTHKPVDLSNTFDENGKALFDYLIVYGETTTTDDGTTDITAPTSKGGSNALTPYYVYRRIDGGSGYTLVQMVENANTPNKVDVDGESYDFTYEDEDNGTMAIDVVGSLKVYMTGFCPYATTGYTPNQEGVWLFRGSSSTQGDPTELDIYLEDCHIFSRYKTENGKTMSKDDETVESFEGDVAIGSGAVFVFEDTECHKKMDNVVPFKVTIHTLGDNLLRSNYGNFFEIFGMRAAQISAPLHIHMQSVDHVDESKTELTLDDVWPTAMEITEETYTDEYTGSTYVEYNYNYTSTKRTNGFLSLQKPNGNNNGPSIDLGNKHSIVNFKGGRVELQNAQIVSPNYKTTLAISHRSGKFGGDETGIQFAFGIGTDDVGGTVNFYDGTTTVQPMTVKEEYRKYYLMDKDEQGNELTTTSCLRCPSNTYVYGGSQCFMRACSHVTSKGGAPKGLNKDGEEVVLGQYVYTLADGDVVTADKLVESMGFPEITANGDMSGCVHRDYGKSSISPDVNNKLYFWVPEDCGGVEAEKDAILKTWKACMTRIEAGYQTKTGAIGGDVSIENTEEIQNLLYCKLDKDIYNVISAHTVNENGEKEYTYQAPVKVPDIAEGLAGGEYTYISPTQVGDDTPGDDLSHEIESTQGDEYKVNGKVYYITTATADVWMNFTAPFDVEKIWVVEPFDEGRLASTAKEEGKTLRESILLQQAQYNADFAAFFGVAMALGSEANFESIFKDWREWAFKQDKFAKFTDAEKIEDYHLRDKYELIPYDGTNADASHFYLNLDGFNKEDGKKLWEYVAQGNQEEIKPNWEVPAAPGKGEILLHQGKTYSLLFPYCVGCWDMDGQTAKKREYWDYWSGKFLIFESTTATAQNPHVIKGEKYLEEEVLAGEDEIPSGRASLRGNSTFTFMNTNKGNVYSYSAAPANEGFVGNTSGEPVDILPTQSFLLLSTSFDTDEEQISFISRSGMIRREEKGEDLGTGGHMPTLADGSDIFVLSTFDGINIAVTEPQYVGVFAANGTLLFNGWVEKSVNVALMNKGVYVVVGENVSVKVIY